MKKLHSRENKQTAATCTNMNESKNLMWNEQESKGGRGRELQKH